MQTKLLQEGWLRRAIELQLPDGPHVVEYDGTGLGYEQVTVDGFVIRQRSWLWFAPRFNFKLRGCRCAVEVRVWPWLTLRSLVLRVKGCIVYAEGVDSVEAARDEAPGEWDAFV